MEGRPNWEPLKREKYLAELNRLNASTIFLARTRMVDVKNNFRKKYKDTTCRACGSEPETQEHVLDTCQSLHPNPSYRVTNPEIFETDPKALQVVAQKIRKTLEKLNSQTV